MSEEEKQYPQRTVIITNNPKSKTKTTPALLINTVARNDMGFAIEGLLINEFSGQRTLQKFPLNSDVALSHFKALPTEFIRIIKQLFASALQYQKEKLALQYVHEDGSIDKETFIQKGLVNYHFNIFQQLKPFASLVKWYYQGIDDDLLTTTVTKPAAVSNYSCQLNFELARTTTGILRLFAFVNINGNTYSLTEFSRTSFLLRGKSEFFLLKPKDADVLEKFSDGYRDGLLHGEQNFIKQIVDKLAEHYPVNKTILLKREVVDIEPQCNVYLSELNNAFLMLKPHWRYAEFEIEDDEKLTTEIFTTDVVYEIRRKADAENAFKELLRSQNKKFSQQNNGFFYLSFAEAEKSQWLVKCYRKLTDQNIGILGMETLKHFRYNMNTPEIKFEFNGKGIDWFDLEVEINFGDQRVTLGDLQKAILHKQQHIILGDGSIGAIPEEWIAKYSMLFKLGETTKNKLRLSNLHWTLSDEIEGGEEIRKKIISTEHIQKWERLQTENQDVYAVPEKINAQLRDYQKAGFNWMCLLDEMQWGGCLADDMGLGKTLQTISFIQHLSDKYKNETHLVVCPTSLMYNWEQELKKFAPQLDYTIYHGAGRLMDEKEWKKKNLIITSYGTVRSDAEQLSKFKFGYTILDESHVIKNSASLATKAMQQLNTRNKLILSGTPIQNNTFDLYAQMNFVNPGLLGNKEFFKTTFATPIDKFGNREASQKLRKLIFPFLLRRTKEQVAKDLPPKTEMILWCEMGDEQRKEYDAVKDYYRESILQKIETDGMGSHSIEILSGLTKLRQICNSTALVKGSNREINESVKLEELMREIEENIGDRKALVFSQFTGMLELIRKEMDAKGISYVYLDGGTKAETRQDLVKQFQSDASIKIFLISLKAGGVGLTLTAADYVYLVDPWWNPAAEQQAIDRSHRIGQQNSVFAYRMICRDTVEEKILELQQRKKVIAEELIAEDSGFIKKLTTEDVAFLFS